MNIFKSDSKKIKIISIDEWFKHCPPKKKEKHWVDGRSAKEMAKFWTNDKSINDFKTFIQQKIIDFNYGYAFPEYESVFDNYSSPRCHDLFICSTDSKTIITIEGKVDEPFGKKKFGEKYKETLNTKKDNDSSKAFDRVVNLRDNYFNGNEKINDIMYQLTYWFAGSLSDAIRFNADNFVMVLQEFTTDLINLGQMLINHNAFIKFIELISEEKCNTFQSGKFLGPINNVYTKGKNLYIGYFSTYLQEKFRMR